MADQDHSDGRSARPRLQRSETMMTARRVAAAKYDLELIKRDVCRWLSETLQLEVTPQTFMATLDTGVALCRLVELVQQKARVVDASNEEESMLKIKIPLDPIKYHNGAKKATFHARENTKHFLDWCRGLGIRDDLIFETNGLVEHSDEKRVLLCLLEVSRYARRVNIKPPDIVSKEQEAIERAEAMDEHVVEEDATNQDVISDSSKQEIEEISKPRESTAEQNPPPQSRGPSELTVVSEESERRFVFISRFLDQCSYPIFFSLILLLLLLVGGGVYLRRRK